MTTLKEGLEKATENMSNPVFSTHPRAWGYNLDWFASQGRAVKIYDAPENYWPENETDYPLEQWLVAQVDPDGTIWPLDGRIATMEAQRFLWDAFCDVDAVGVELDDLLTWPGLKLTPAQVASVKAHYYQPEEWTKEDEDVSDLVADATDCENFEELYSWLVWAVGDLVAADLVEEWENED